jgi:arylformamidase
MSAGTSAQNFDGGYDLRAAFPDYEQYFAEWRFRSRQAREQLPCLLDVSYGERPRERVDFFRATAQGPLLVFIHGGYWRSLDKSDFSFLAAPFLEHGVSLALMNYTLFPGTTMTKVVAEVRAGFRWIANNAPSVGISYSTVHLAGWSAGAHLGSMIAVEGSCDLSVQAPVSFLAISGVYDLRPLLLTSANADLALDVAEATANSPVHAKTPPRTGSTAILWGARETDEFKRQSLLLHNAWRGSIGELISMEIPDEHHYGVMHALGQDGSTVFQIALKLLKLPNA